MKTTKTLNFTESQIKAMTQFREEVFHPMCDFLDEHCELCPFSEACFDIVTFLDKAITDKHWNVPTKGE